MPNVALKLTAHASVAARSLCSRAAMFVEAPQLNAGALGGPLAMTRVPRLTVAVVLLAACERPALRGSAAIPDGWTSVSPPIDGTEAARCANYARDEWAVSLSADGDSLLISAPTLGPADTLLVERDLLAGDDHGEFGGAIWHQVSTTSRDTIEISGRDTSGFYVNNLRGFVRRSHEVYAVVGLGHLGLRQGELLYLYRSPAGWKGRSILQLKSAPQALAKVAADTLLVVTSDSLLAIALDSLKPTRTPLAGNGAWYLTYANSVLRDSSGVVFIGMRGAVARLTPTKQGLREDWLVPTSCRVRTLTSDASCTCKAS
jgi:hypothetical protein